MTAVHQRPVRPEDARELAELCCEHAQYERAELDPDGLAERLAHYLFAERPSVYVIVADTGERIVGYASWSRAASTWRAQDYAYLDCLYLRPAARGRGIGADLLRAVARACVTDGLDRIEWQTPAWNEDALRFYRRLGATSSAKERCAADTALLARTQVSMT